MSNQIKHWLAAPVFEDDSKKSWRAGLLNAATNVCIFAVTLVTVGNLLGGNTPASVFVIDGIMLLVLFSIRGVLRSGHVSLAGILLVTLGIGLITAAIAGLGTIRTPTTAFLILIVIIAGLTFGKKGLILSVVPSSLVVLGLSMAENSGILPAANTSVTITQWISYTVAFALTGLLTNFAYQSMQDALEHAFAEAAERRRAEEAYENIVNNSLQAYAIYQDERFVFVNPQAEHLTGYSREELYAMPAGQFFSLIIDDEREERAHVYRNRIAGTDFNQRIQFRITRKDGAIRWLESFSTIITYQGKPALQAAYLDITEQKIAEEQLRKLSRAVEAAPVTVLITDKDGRIEYANPFFSRVTGYALDEVVGENPKILKSGLTPAHFYPQLWNTIQAGQPWEGEFINKKKNGDLYTELALISPILDVHGNVTHFVSIKQDITERRRAEIALHESEKRYRFLFERANDAIFIFTFGPRFVDANQKALDLLGYERPEFQKMAEPVSILIDPAEQSQVKHVIERLMAGEVLSPFQRVFLHKDGHQVFTEVSISRNSDDQFILIVRDISERLAYQKALAESEERFRILFEDSADAYFILDGKSFSDCNQAAVELLRASSKEEVLLHHPVEISPEYQPDGSLSIKKADEMVRLSMEEGSQRFEWMHRRMNGEEFPAEILLTPIAVGGKTIIHAVLRDITERKRIENELRQSEANFREVFDNIAHGIFINEITEDGEFRSGMLNKADEILTSIRREDVEGKLLKDLPYPANFIESIRANYQRCVDAGVSIAYEEEFNLPGAGQRFYYTTLAPVRDETGRFYRIIGSTIEITELKRLQAELERLATTDSLTGVYNRRQFARLAEIELERARRYNHPTSVVMMDADYFKKVNDTCGHMAGDRVLVTLAKLVTKEVRTSDLVARYGGEEFMLLLPETTLEQAQSIAERIRCSVANTLVEADDQIIHFTISLGVTSSEKAGQDFEHLFHEADRLLYKAKEAGRNRVVSSSDDENACGW